MTTTLALGLLVGALIGYLTGRIARPKSLTWQQFNEINKQSKETVIFTTTNDGQDELFDDHIDAHPLLSRCVTIKLTNQG